MCLPWCRLCRPVRPQRRFHRPLRRLRRPWRRKPPRLAPPVWRGQGHHVSRPACALFAAGNTLGPAKRCNRRARRASPGSSAAQESVVGCAFGARRRRCAHPRHHSAGHRAGHAGARTPRRYAPGGHSQTAWAARPHESARTRCSAENAPLAEGIAGAVCTLLQVGTRYTCTTGPKQPEFENNMHRFHGNMMYQATSAVIRPEFHGRIAAGQDGHRAERDQNQSFRTMYFIYPHRSDVFGGRRPHHTRCNKNHDDDTP